MAAPFGRISFPSAGQRRWVDLLLVGVILAAGWFAFFPALHGDWVWDDVLDVTGNPLLRDADGLRKIWFDPTGLYDYYPVKYTVQWLQWHLWHNDTFGYHLTNVGLHLVSAFLVWHLLRKLGARGAWLGALLFTVHPLVVESVAWIAELKNTLSLPPLLAAFSCWLSFDEHGRRRDYLGALLLFLVAMLCKTSVVMFPVTLLLHASWRRGRTRFADVKASAPFFAVSLVLGLVTIWFQHHRALTGIEADLPLAADCWTRLAGAGGVLAFCFWKCVLPVALMPVYPQWAVAPSVPWLWLPWVVLAALLFWSWRNRATWGRHTLFGLGWFLLNLAPFLGFFAISYQRFTWVMDHLVYMPLLGLIGLAAAGAGAALDRLRLPVRGCALAGIGTLCGALTFASHRHAAIFQSDDALWTYTVQHNPGAWLAHYNLGNVRMKQGRTAEAIRAYEQAVQLRPDLAEAQCGLGVALLCVDRRGEAIPHLQAALLVRPAMAEAHTALANAFAANGRLGEALPHYAEAVRLKPADANFQFNLGNALLQSGRFQEAAAHLREAVRLDPTDAQARQALAAALARLPAMWRAP
jgi:protein O-mannosyl-transferase